jgi:hypothetical protein
MKISFIEQENSRHHLVRSNHPQTSRRRMKALLILARKKFLSNKLRAHVSAGAISGKTFIWLPFAGGISAFAVILPQPRE